MSSIILKNSGNNSPNSVEKILNQSLKIFFNTKKFNFFQRRKEALQET